MQGIKQTRGRPREGSLVDAAMAARALDAATPLIEKAMRDRVHGDSGFLHVVVMDPARGPGVVPPWSSNMQTVVSRTAPRA